MKERPILFSGEMVRAILDGRKTLTRRAFREQPPEGCGAIEGPQMFAPLVFVRGEEQPGPEIFGAFSEDGEWSIKCPYGQPGDRLWVREAWQAWTEFNDCSPRDIPSSSRINYLADGNVWDSRGRPSIHMPRWASRITLEITGVRVERLQEISEADARAEGAAFHDGGAVGHSGWRHDMKDVHVDARSSFARLWAAINGPDSWEANPWVWVVEFKRVEQEKSS